MWITAPKISMVHVDDMALVCQRKQCVLLKTEEGCLERQLSGHVKVCRVTCDLTALQFDHRLLAGYQVNCQSNISQIRWSTQSLSEALLFKAGA